MKQDGKLFTRSTFCFFLKSPQIGFLDKEKGGGGGGRSKKKLVKVTRGMPGGGRFFDQKKNNPAQREKEILEEIFRQQKFGVQTAKM